MREQTLFSTREKTQAVHWFALAGIMVLYVLLRLPWIGHLLSWDEAMNLCAVRSFAAHGRDFSTDWFWHHPPLLNVLYLLEKPLRPGFAGRAELLMILIGLLNMGALYSLTKRVLSMPVALWACFMYAIMPAAVGYDLWLKQDTLASLFGLFAILAFMRKKPMLSGLLMGFGFLAKETAMFYAFAIGLIWLLSGPERRMRSAVEFCVTALVVSAWWFFAFSSSIRYFIAFALNLKGMTTDVWIWARPWHYFLVKLPVDLGAAGTIFFIMGIIGLAVYSLRRGLTVTREALWPLFVVVPAYVIFSLARGKACWFTIVLFPAMAVIEGIGILLLIEWAVSLVSRFRVGRFEINIARIGLSAALGFLLIAGVWGRDYESWLKAQDGGIWWGAAASRQAATMLNCTASDEDRALITPMYFWEGRDGIPCPIFTWYLKDIPVVFRPFDVSPDEIAEAAREYDLDWIMISPDPKTAAREIINPLKKEYGIHPHLMRGAMIFSAEKMKRGVGD